jgi:hypothetical protein
MKKFVFLTIIIMLLSGCSFLSEAQNTITYINEATDYLAKANDFANEAPQLAQQAVEDLQAGKELKKMLQDMENEIEAFNDLQVPDLAADLHQQLMEKNNVILAGIDLYLKNFKDGKLDPAMLENTELFQTVQEVSSIIDQIKQLGN